MIQDNILLRGVKKRARAYKHKQGAFVLTASFKDSEVNRALINYVGKLSASYSQRAIASAMRCSTSTIGKMVRIYHYKNGL